MKKWEFYAGPDRRLHPKIQGPELCKCGQPTFLVKWGDYGWVKAICSNLGCNKTHKNGLSLDMGPFEELKILVSCPKCDVMAKPVKEENNKLYCYQCDTCEIQVMLADLLPDKSKFIDLAS